MVFSMLPNIGFNFSVILATNVILFLINFHYTFFLLHTDAALHIACKAISPIPKLFHTLFPFHESSNRKKIFKVTLKQQTDYYLINYLCPNIIPKYYFYFTFPFFDLSQTRSSVYHFRPLDFFTVFFNQKMVPPNGYFSNRIHYQAAHQPLVSQIYIQVTLNNLLL